MTDAFEWQGRVGEAWAEEWRRTDRTLAPVGAALADAAVARLEGIEAPAILDIGCGAGATSLALAERIPGARVTGIDLSEPLIEVARMRAPGLTFEVADAGAWAGGTGFDALVSRHGVMFFDDPVAAFTHLRSLGAPGVRLTFSCFRSRDENGWAAELLPIVQRFAPAAAAPSDKGPFAFADPARIRAILAGAGFPEPEIAPFDFAFVAGEGDDPVADALAYFGRIGPFAALLRELDEAQRTEARAMLAEIAARHRRGNEVRFSAAAWIVSA